MTLKAILGRRWMRALGLAGVAAAGYVFGITSDRLTAQQPGTPPPADKRVVAYIYGSIPVTREDLGEFLIARGGHEKLELLVNKKIIEVEAAKRKVTVTPTEIEASLNEDLRGMGITFKDFTTHILPRYNKSLYEWTEDVIKPKILLGKMCRDRVKVAEEDLQKAFENKYGERRQAKVICWNEKDLKIAQKQWGEARESDAEFDRVARMQPDQNLAAAAGLIAPIGKHPASDDPASIRTTQTLFNLKQGEISELIQTSAGVMCFKCVAIIPKDPMAKLEGKVREAFEKEMYDKKIAEMIPVFFKECKEAANPNVFLKGPPSPQELREYVNGVMQTGGIAPPSATPTPKPMTPPMTPPPAPKP
ncbi:MAG: hypothetical protein K8U57_00665 [Planctomycetes bacterium]|nr:hypothetical protein [Planctomycetota bacterium]